MAEQKAVDLPKRLPDPRKAVNLFCEFRETPIPFLANLTLKDICKDIDADQTWITGSRIWHPVVYGKQAPMNKDIDIVFPRKGMALDFIGNLFNRLYEINKSYNNGKLTYVIAENTLGGNKLLDAKTNTSLVDAWELETDQSIAEHISGFQWPHERVAILFGACKDEINSLTRLIKYDVYGNRDRDRKKTVSYDYGS